MTGISVGLKLFGEITCKYVKFAQVELNNFGQFFACYLKKTETRKI